MWTWHTRTWVESGAVHQTLDVGFGWYIVIVAVFVLTAVLAWRSA